jgi:hypothetical protein
VGDQYYYLCVSCHCASPSHIASSMNMTASKRYFALAAGAAAGVFMATHTYWPYSSISSEGVTSHDARSSAAYKQSYGLFDDISDLMWERFRSSTKSKSLYWNPSNPLDKVGDMTFWNGHNPRPNFICPHTVNLGAHSEDGVKYLCYPERLTVNFQTNLRDDSSCLIYSFGCAGNFLFEDEIFKMHGKKCETHVFDPAKKWERKGDIEAKNIHYHPWGLLSTYDRDNKSKVWPAGHGGAFKTMPEILKDLGHEQRTIDVLKIDCEGCGKQILCLLIELLHKVKCSLLCFIHIQNGPLIR